MKKILFVMMCLINLNASADDFRTKGYMGFGEESTLTDFDKWWGGVSTTHGYQINPHFFVGGGVGVLFSYNNKNNSKSKVGVPLYGDFRYTMLKSRVTPFFEGKVGYSVADYKGFYASPTIGVDVAITEKFGLYGALAYEYYGIGESRIVSYSRYSYYSTSKTSDLHTMTVRIGVHF